MDINKKLILLADNFHKVVSYITSLFITGCVTVTDGQLQKVANPILLSESRVNLGVGYLQQGNMIRAYQNFQQALVYAPNYYRAQLSMAHYYERVGDEHKASKMYQSALNKHYNNGHVLNNYATFLCKKNLYDAADTMFNKAIAQPDYSLVPNSYENAGLCALKAGKTEKAKYNFRRAIDHDPYRPVSLLQLAKLQLENEEYSSAQKSLSHFYQAFGTTKAYLELMVVLETALGNMVSAEEHQNHLDNLV
ncbi:type IV pilus biogenesis/stability protein PilW [Vibrio sagamiensis]|uniref:Type IV pilus biogenesis/stability protein PilW n=1 Tax=Vibrio sagamiensis NBRC 104589 TaxID=1219064 RepID=A0A511QB50_9VIBR|nr:type IV pilus biogenesis/stability protein PilW [Vibrio sagamiensis]PNQ54185.1 type IV pilus biogenesis/stability protein PilW [Vibrio agarivorans]GEM74524.1 type IV pilus biogenesis/stability protein PilW [Vibrio sagamiensis NBRC 104589]